MICITGDTHGGLERFKGKQLRGLGKGDVLIVLGDFGFVWDGGREEQARLDWLAKRPYTILFLDGTHENFDLLDALPVEERFGGRVQPLRENIFHICRGSILELEGLSFLCFGGGESPDKLQGTVCADPRRPKQVFGFYHPAGGGEQPPARLFRQTGGPDELRPVAVRLLPPRHPPLAQSALPVRGRGAGGGTEKVVETPVKQNRCTRKEKVVLRLFLACLQNFYSLTVRIHLYGRGKMW